MRALRRWHHRLDSRDPSIDRFLPTWRAGHQTLYETALELMAKPGPLSFGVLARLGGHPIEVRGPIELAAHVPSYDFVSGRLPRGRVRRHGIQQVTHLVRPSGIEHCRRARRDARRQLHARIDQKITGPVCAGTSAGDLELAEPLAGERRHLDG